MSRINYHCCLMTFHLACLVIYLSICLHDTRARDWRRISPEPWIKGYVRRRTIQITSTIDPITPSMGPLPSTASSMQSNLPEENIWSMPVTIVMGLAIVAFAVGLCLAVRNMWNKHQQTSNTQGDKQWKSSNETMD